MVVTHTNHHNRSRIDKCLLASILQLCCALTAIVADMQRSRGNDHKNLLQHKTKGTKNNNPRAKSGRGSSSPANCTAHERNSTQLSQWITP
jgi:hypothetical protein